ncbi:hypothetical protein KCU98_g2880, partial [Aureobasidium melanogenum]
MASDSKVRYAAVNGSPNAINVARPVRAGRQRSSLQSHRSFNTDQSGSETVADALAHLLPAAQVHSSRTETIVVEDSDNEAGPSTYPVTPMTSPIAPVFSPLTPVHVDDQVGAAAEISAVRDKNTPEHSPTRKSKKRKASADVPVIPPPRQLRLKTRCTTATFKTTSKSKESSAPKTTKASKSASTTKGKNSTEGIPGILNRTIVPETSTRLHPGNLFPPPPDPRRAPTIFDEMRRAGRANQTTNPLITLARNIENPGTFINAVTESDSLTLDPDKSLSGNATDNMSASERVIHNITVTARQLLRRQRVLIHDYDTFDVQTYSPGVRVDAGTAALR